MHRRSEPGERVGVRRYPPARTASGWLVLTRNGSMPRIVDALHDAPPHRAFTQTELAEVAGVSRQSVHRHLDLLLDAGILTPVS